MRTFFLILAFALTPAGLLAQAAVPVAQEPAPPTLSETQLLKAELFRLQVEREALTRDLATCRLAVLEPVRKTLEADFLKTVKAPDGSLWDWSRNQPAAPAPVSPPKK